ncbi:MAG: DUF3231 family protein [Firmicutes bacterium]|nr:DUF3231 family protein [Bacillota bacterium]
MGLIDKIVKQKDIDSGIHSGEAYILWTQLIARYDSMELVDFILNCAKDLDFKLLIQRGVESVIKPQIKELEKAMNHYRIPLPSRPPKSQNLPANAEAFKDNFLYKLLLDGSQTALTVHVKAINICMNDSLRNMFLNFFNQDAHLYDSLVKYGKVKGWLDNAPIYKNS